MAPKCQVKYLYCAWDLLNKLIVIPLIVYILQAKLNSKESQVADLQENIKSQQAEASKAKDELTSTLTTMEKLKESFKAEQAGSDTEKSALLKRAEDAEAALEPVSVELASLKQQINAMTTAVFGKIASS